MTTIVGVHDDILAPPGRASGWLLRRIVAVAVAVLVVAGLGLAGYAWWRAPSPCADLGDVRGDGYHLSRDGGACVGWTIEHAYAFAPELDDVTEAIAAQNVEVARSGRPYVRIGLFMSLRSSDTSALTMKTITAAVRGAFTAQMRENTDAALGADLRFQLVLANEGPDQAQWPLAQRRLVEDLRGDRAHPLVAVTGMGVSVPETTAAFAAFAREGIPVVGSVLSADTMTGAGVFNVAPSNADYVDAMVPYIAGLRGAHAAELVFDNTRDDFANTLAADYRAKLQPLIQAEFAFVGSRNAGSAAPTLFRQLVSDMCTNGTDLVLYAGRDNDLDDLIAALSRRQDCFKGPPTPLTILAGATGLDSVVNSPDIQDKMRSGHITVVNASATNAPAWLRGEHAPAGFADFHRQWRDLKFPDTGLDNGYAIMHYDGVFVAAEAARQAASQIGVRTLSAADVTTFLQNSHDSQLRAAASGSLSFSGGVSWAYDRPVSVVAIPAAGPAPEPYVARRIP